MRKISVNADNYLKWLLNITDISPSDRRRYSLLLETLFKETFICVIEGDENRVNDGLYLRERYELECPAPVRSWVGVVPLYDCTVLELMVALADRCEHEIMDELDGVNRTSEWFWIMIDSLGLKDMTNDNFDAGYVDEALYVFMNRLYRKDGKGGLFYIKGFEKDMRKIEIWYQLNWYLNTLERR